MTDIKDSSACFYRDHKDSNIARTVQCSSIVACFTLHDGRGCRAVCYSHAIWAGRQSSHGLGNKHSPDCPGYPEKS